MLIALLIVSYVFFSCKRQTLEEPFRFIAHVPVTIDWSESLLEREDIVNVAISAYPVDGGEPIKMLSDNIYFNVLQLPIGEYHILIHNELLGDVKGLECVSGSDFDQVRSHIMEQEEQKALYDTLFTNDILAEAHNIISTWSMQNLVVNSEMVELTRSEQYQQYINESKTKTKVWLQNTPTKGEEDIPFPTLPTLPTLDQNVESSPDMQEVIKSLENLSKVYPQSENTVLNFHIRVKNLNSAMKVEALLRDTEYGAYLANENREECCDGKRVVYANILRSRVFDDPTNGIDGYMSLEVNTFGARGAGARYYIDFSCALNDGRVLKFPFDITDKIVEAGNQKYITIDLGDIDTPAITLPECGEAGFDVGDWDDEIIVDIL